MRFLRACRLLLGDYGCWGQAAEELAPPTDACSSSSASSSSSTCSSGGQAAAELDAAEELAAAEELTLACVYVRTYATYLRAYVLINGWLTKIKSAL